MHIIRRSDQLSQVAAKVARNEEKLEGINKRVAALNTRMHRAATKAAFLEVVFQVFKPIANVVFKILSFGVENLQQSCKDFFLKKVTDYRTKLSHAVYDLNSKQKSLTEKIQELKNKKELQDTIKTLSRARPSERLDIDLVHQRMKKVDQMKKESFSFANLHTQFAPPSVVEKNKINSLKELNQLRSEVKGLPQQKEVERQIIDKVKARMQRIARKKLLSRPGTLHQRIQTKYGLS